MNGKKAFILATIIGILSTNLVHAQGIPSGSSFEQEAKTLNKDANEKVEAREEVGPEKSRAEKLLDSLGKRLSANETTLGRIEDSIGHAESKVREKEKDIASLNGQITRLDSEVSRSEEKVIAVREQISAVQENLAVLFEEMEIKEVELEAQSKIVREYLEMLYVNMNAYQSANNGEISTLKLLLASDNISDVLKNTTYLSLMNEQGKDLFEVLTTLGETFDRKQNEYRAQHTNLSRLNQVLTNNMNVLRDQRKTKNELLERTEGEEELYQQLLVYARLEQENIAEEIKKLHKNIGYINEKLEALDDEEIDQIEKAINEESKRNYLLSLNAGDISNLPTISWPVYPAKGLSAYFKDESYRQFFGIPHLAVDIPVPQGTIIRSAAPGIVSKVVDRDNGGYSYVIVVHKDGFATLYGHMYSINVKDQDIVHRGDVIGLSGGIPGTKGAGLLTTGAHLHFELFKDGVQVDPLLFLPLKNLPLQYLQNLPKKYIELLEAEKEGEIKNNEQQATNNEQGARE